MSRLTYLTAISRFPVSGAKTHGFPSRATSPRWTYRINPNTSRVFLSSSRNTFSTIVGIVRAERRRAALAVGHLSPRVIAVEPTQRRPLSVCPSREWYTYAMNNAIGKSSHVDFCSAGDRSTTPRRRENFSLVPGSIQSTRRCSDISIFFSGLFLYLTILREISRGNEWSIQRWSEDKVLRMRFMWNSA